MPVCQNSIQMVRYARVATQHVQLAHWAISQPSATHVSQATFYTKEFAKIALTQQTKTLSASTDSAGINAALVKDLLLNNYRVSEATTLATTEIWSTETAVPRTAESRATSDAKVAHLPHLTFASPKSSQQSRWSKSTQTCSSFSSASQSGLWKDRLSSKSRISLR